MSEITKNKHKGAIITGIISILLTIGPALLFFFMGFIRAETHTKVCMSLVMIFSLIMGVLMLLFKAKLNRTTFWVLFIGTSIALDSITSVVATFAICNILDELFVSPLHHKYVNEYQINKQIDRRG